MRNGFLHVFGHHCCFVFFLAVMLANPVNAATWGPYRGMTTQLDITEQDVVDFANLGGNLLRIGFSKQPLMKKQPPYDFDEEAFSKLDQLLNWCEKHGIKVVIDPHTMPGTELNTTTLATDEFWKDFRYHDLFDRLWDRIASRYKNRNHVIAGYDILNEPATDTLPFKAGPSDYNVLIRRIVTTIRRHDKNTTVIIEPPVINTGIKKRVSRFEGLLYLDPPPDSNVVYSPHMYQPGQFTHQGVEAGLRLGPQYPGRIGITAWNKDELRRAMQPALEFQHRYNVPIFISEFSATRLSGASGDRYIGDLIDLFEEFGWSWTYHSWRQAPAWDAEIAETGNDERKRSANTPKLQILRDAFRRNTSP